MSRFMDWLLNIKHAEKLPEEPYTISTSYHLDFYSNDVAIKIKAKDGYQLFEMNEYGEFVKVEYPSAVYPEKKLPVKILLVQNIEEHKNEEHMRFKLNDT